MKTLAKQESLSIISKIVIAPWSREGTYLFFYFLSMPLYQRFLIACALILVSALYILPWKSFGVHTDFLNKPYTLGLDLQGGVELDYQVDLSAIHSGSTEVHEVVPYNEHTIIEGLKHIIDRRVDSLGLSTPTIQTVRYGSDTHIVVQIPTHAYEDLTPEAREKQRMEDIKNAKETIGKVVKLEFREQKQTFSPEDYAERKQLAELAQKDLSSGIPFSTIYDKYAVQHERVEVNTATGALPEEITPENIQDATTFPHLFPVFESKTTPTYTLDESGQPIIQSGTGYTVLRLDAQTGSGTYAYSYVTVDAEPSGWTPAKTADGKILGDQYLVNAGVTFNNVGQPQVDLVFNEE